MSFFQKKPTVESIMPLYTLNSSRTILVVGLGNPGAEYDRTRHNIGFDCLDSFAAGNEFDPWVSKKDLKCILTSKTLGSTRVILIKPTTFMNLSGDAVQEVAHFYKLAANTTLVVHDELDIPFGQIRTRSGGSSAGHNGIKSIAEQIGDDFGRVRVGIGPKRPAQIDAADFVLQTFSKIQQENMKALYSEVAAILTEYLYSTQPLPADTRSFLI